MSDRLPADAEFTSQDRHAALTAWLERDRDVAWQDARYERHQRDEYTSKIRFGLAALNGASLVTILHLSGNHLTTPILTAATAFAVATVLAGYSVFNQQTHLIRLAGDVSTRAITLDRAVSLCQFPVGSKEHELLGEAMRGASDLSGKSFAFSATAIWCQWLSAAGWFYGVVVAGISMAGYRMMSVTEMMQWFHIAGSLPQK